MLTPTRHVVLGLEMLQTPLRTTLSETDRAIVAEARARGHAQLVVFRGRDDAGRGSWRLGPTLDARDRTRVCERVLRETLPVCRELVRFGLFPHLLPEGNPLRDLLLPLWAEGLRPHSMWGSWGMGLTGIVTLILFVAVTRPESLAERWNWLAGLAGLVGTAVLLGVGLSLPGAAGADDTLSAVQRIWEPGGPLEPRAVSLKP